MTDLPTSAPRTLVRRSSSWSASRERKRLQQTRPAPRATQQAAENINRTRTEAAKMAQESLQNQQRATEERSRQLVSDRAADVRGGAGDQRRGLGGAARGVALDAGLARDDLHHDVRRQLDADRVAVEERDLDLEAVVQAAVELLMPSVPAPR